MTLLNPVTYMIPIFIIGGTTILGLIIWAVVVAARKERERREALMAWANEHGYQTNFKDDRESYKPYLFFDALNAGSNRYFKLQIRGEYEALPFLVFEYHYETHSTNKDGQRQTHHHHVRGCIIETGLNFPAELKVRPENFLDKFTAAVGFNDIDFESAEFSKKFYVKSKDRKFAFDFIHQGMMEYLLAHPKTTFEVEHHAIMVQASGKGKVEDYQELLRHTREILEQIPDYFIQAQSS